MGLNISSEGIKVDMEKVDLIVNLPLSIYVKDRRYFLGYAGFHRRFIKDFSKVAKTLSSLITKDMLLCISNECELTFMKHKED